MWVWVMCVNVTKLETNSVRMSSAGVVCPLAVTAATAASVFLPGVINAASFKRPKRKSSVLGSKYCLLLFLKIIMQKKKIRLIKNTISAA